MSERFAAAARAAGDEVELVVEPDEGHFGHLEPGNPLWRAVTRWLRPAEPRGGGGGRRRRSARRLPRALRATPTSAIYLDGNSLGRLPVATRERLSGADGGVGRAARRRLARMDRRADPHGRPDRRADRRAARARCVVCDSTTVNLFKLVGAALDARERTARS